MSAAMPPVLAGKLDPRNVACAIALCEAHGSSHHIPLFKSAGVGRIAMTCLTDRLSRPNLYALNRAKQPALILIGDDDDSVTGPMGWAATAQVMQWARAVFVHASGGDQRSYMLGVTMAEDVGRLLLVETSSDAAEAWVAALQHADVPTVLLLPTGDGIYPVEPEPEQERAA